MPHRKCGETKQQPGQAIKSAVPQFHSIYCATSNQNQFWHDIRLSLYLQQNPAEPTTSVVAAAWRTEARAGLASDEGIAIENITSCGFRPANRSSMQAQLIQCMSDLQAHIEVKVGYGRHRVFIKICDFGLNFPRPPKCCSKFQFGSKIQIKPIKVSDQMGHPVCHMQCI